MQAFEQRGLAKNPKMITACHPHNIHESTAILWPQSAQFIFQRGEEWALSGNLPNINHFQHRYRKIYIFVLTLLYRKLRTQKIKKFIHGVKN